MRQLIFFLVISCFISARAITQSAGNSLPASNTFAIIVGISEYENITKLNFAHRDAEEFEKFLLSKAGGSVPSDNIRMLLNENATYTSIYNALYWLRDIAGKDDLVYFYFSGHGDIENTSDNLGFLLPVNTPRTNYLHNAVRIEDLNRIANSLSVTKGSRVIMITDACHSGDLAGKTIRGNQLTGDQLRTASGKEIRITSCGPNELSNEDEKWGGGRGVFSYYLVKGLEGLADYSNDKVVTLEEVKNYLGRSFQTDKVLSQKENTQTPVISGTLPTPLARVDKQRVDSISLSTAPVVENNGSGLKPLGTSPQGYFFSLIDKWNVEKQVDFHKLRLVPSYEIPYEFIRQTTEAGTRNGKYDSTIINKLINSLETNPGALKRFNDKLIELLADRGQRMINLYLEGDEAELEKRRYYSRANSDYEVFAAMFEVALMISPPGTNMYNSSMESSFLPECLELKFHYFSGVAARLKMPLLNNTDSLLTVAFSEQQKAYAIEKNAAYINNELGILYKQKKNFVEAEKKFIRATQIAPNWAMPWANLAGLYAQLNKKENGFEAAAKARQLQPGYQGAYINTGILYEKNNNFLLAEEFFRKSILLNSRHYLPFERLGYVYMNTTRYAQADSFFLEADIRKRGFNFIDSDGDGVVDDFDQDVMAPSPPCQFDTTKVKANDIIGNFYIALNYIQKEQYDKAEWKLKQITRLNPTHPLAFHYLGKLVYEQKRWQEADICFNYAIKNYLPKEQFDQYCDSLIKLFPQYANEGGSDLCAFIQVSSSWVSRTTKRFFLADTYEKWNHPDEAEQQLRLIIVEEPNEIGAYKKLWKILENRGRLFDAELSIRSYPDNQTVENELFAFYERAIAKYTQAGEWYLKAGSLMHAMVMANPEMYKEDMKFIPPDTKKEEYRDNIDYKAQSFEQHRLPAIDETYILYGEVEFPRTEGIRLLLKADSIIADADMATEINNKLGDLYTGQGLPDKAIACFKKVIELHPADANARMKFVVVNDITYNFASALEQLDSLNKRGEINYDNQVQLARYCIHAGRFADGLKLLQQSAKADQLKAQQLNDLNGRLQLLSGQLQKALPFYSAYNTLYPGDAGTMYTLARIYALQNKQTEAFKWLKQSIDKGFNYYWVLKFDESWNKLRSSAKWKEMTENIKPAG
jgi:Flp pilus assembly protein TadD